MLDRLVEIVTGGKKAVTNRSYLGSALDKVCPHFVARYEEVKAANETVDALDILSSMVMNEIQPGNIEVAAARAYLSILIENEHLPVAHQLSESDLECLKQLFMGYFCKSDDVNAKGAQVLSLIERKFGSGEFSQARILLQIFETNEETRLNNERNLYYEEMISRLDMVLGKNKGIQHVLVDAAVADNASDEAIIKALNAIERENDAHFCLYLIDQAETTQWMDALDSIEPEIRDYIMEYIPVIHWSPIGLLAEPIGSQIGRHMTFEMLRRHVQNKLRMCYFLLLASGNTGYEWFIFAFTEWSRIIFGVDVREVLPMLHRCSVVESMCFQEVLDIVTDRFYGPAMNRVTMTPEDLDIAYRKVIQRLLANDACDIPKGSYSFGDFILDELLPFDYEDPSFAFRLYNMM